MLLLCEIREIPWQSFLSDVIIHERSSNQRFQNLLGADRNHRARTEHVRHARLEQLFVGLRRNNTADEHQDVSRDPSFFSSEMTSGTSVE